MRFAAYALCALVFLPLGCTFSMKYDQCMEDGDCAPNGDAKQFCTSDHICVPDTPEERLCTVTLPSQPAAQALHIGALISMPKDQLTPAITVRLNVMELAVQEINDLAKTDQARPLVLHLCDISGSAGDALNSMSVLIKTHHVAAIIGPDSQAALSDVVGVAASESIPVLSPGATASAVVQLPSRGFILRMAPVDTQQASTIAREVPNGTLLGLISSEDSYGNNVRRSFLSAWTNRDPNNILKFGYSYTETVATQLANAASELLADQPTYAVTIVSNTQTELIEKLKDLPNSSVDPTNATQIVTSDKAHSDSLLALAARPEMAAHFGRLRGIGPLSLSNSVEATEFKTDFQAHYPSDRLSSDLYAGYAYDAVYVLAAALNSIKGDISGTAVLDVLRRANNSMKVLPLSRVTFADTVRTMTQGDTFTLTGATGAIRFTPEGSRDPSLYERWTIDLSKPGQPDYLSTPL